MSCASNIIRRLIFHYLDLAQFAIANYFRIGAKCQDRGVRFV